MAPLFSTIAFFGLIVAAIFGIVWIVGRLRHRQTKAHIVCIVAAVVAVAGFVAFGLTYEPVEKTEEPAASSTEAATEEPTEPQPEETQPTETPAATPETPTAPPQASKEPEPTADTPQAPKPSERPTEAAPEPTPKPTPEPTEEVDPVEQDKQDIEAAARDIAAENYTNTDIDRITVNEDHGTDADGDYILLVYATWNVKNSADMTKKVLAMYSEDFAARVGSDIPKVSEFTIFWTVPYHSETKTAVKYAYERIGDGMTEASHMINIK